MCIELANSDVAGELGVFHLKRLWSRCLRERFGFANGGDHANEWAFDNVLYHGLNLPVEETIQFLYQYTPSFAEFESWVLERNGGAIQKNTVDRINATIGGLLTGYRGKTAPEPFECLLGEDDISFFHEQGYIVVSGLYSDDDVNAAQAAVWEHLGMDPNDPQSWHRRTGDHGIMVQFFHHPALEVIRRSPKLRNVFAQIWGTSDLWVSTDRVSFNPPERPRHEFPGPRLHWDVSLELPIPFGVQGLVYLTDTAADQGAFTCVPGFHNRIESWLKSLPEGSDPRCQKLWELGAIPISGKSGDLVIWHQALPHGSSPNRAMRPRIVEYVTMFPADAEYCLKWK